MAVDWAKSGSGFPIRGSRSRRNWGKRYDQKGKREYQQRELFQSELEEIIDLHHPLVRLGRCIDWSSFAELPGATYHPEQGAPGITTRLMVALHLLKYQHDLSDEAVLAHWVEHSYRQHFSGERYFQLRAPVGGPETCFSSEGVRTPSLIS